jgi:hypothetical protein
VYTSHCEVTFYSGVAAHISAYPSILSITVFVPLPLAHTHFPAQLSAEALHFRPLALGCRAGVVDSHPCSAQLVVRVTACDVSKVELLDDWHLRGSKPVISLSGELQRRRMSPNPNAEQRGFVRVVYTLVG